MKTTQRLFITCALLIFSFNALAQQDSITISGALKGLQNNKVFLSFKDENGQNKNYSAVAVDNAFTIKVPKSQFPLVARLNTSIDRTLSVKVNAQTIANPASLLDLLVFNENVYVTGDVLLLQFASLSGDEENNLFEVFKKSTRADETKSYLLMKDAFNARYNQLKIKYTEQEINEQQTAIFKRTRDLRKSFISQHPEAFISVWLLSKSQNFYTVQDYINAWDKLSDKYKKGDLAESIKKYIKNVNVIPAGTLATDFEKNDKDGKTVKLSNFKNRVVLLDFWGSCCGPCRASHPHLKELYSKYKADGFEIIGIAQERQKTIDDSKMAWNNAIKEDGINWIHVLNQDGISKQDLVKDYSVSAFPTKFLIDKEGKIILRITASGTDDIDKALAKIYGH